MAYSNRSILYTTNANTISRFSRWTSSNADIARGGYNAEYAFLLREKGVMYQRIIPARFYTATPTNFKLSFITKPDSVSQLATLDAGIEIKIAYASGRVDFYLYPLLTRKTDWNIMTDHLVTPSAEEEDSLIDYVDVTIYNNSSIRVRVSKIEMFHSLETQQAIVEDVFDSNKMIMYGLEADLPILR